MSDARPTRFHALGGEPAVRKIVDAFVDRVFDDMMIGFFFRNASRERVKEFEYQHAAEFLGADVVYEGKPLGAAHAAHPIRGGHFERRKEILRQTLVAHAVPDDIVNAWLAHTESLRAEITGDPGSECRH